MSKIIKAQAGVAVKSIPVQRYPAINVGEIVSNLTKKGAEVGHEAISVGSRIGKGALKILSGPLGILTLALSGDMDAQQPYSEMDRMQRTRSLTKRAIPVYGKQSGTSTPVMKKKKKTTKARPTITRTPDEKSTAVPVGSGAIAGSEDAAQRDTVRVTNGAAVENANSQDTVKVQHGNAENTEQTTDDRNILQRLGDRWARRKVKNSKPKTKEPPTNPPQENKGLVKRGFGYIKEHPIKSTLIGGTTVFFVGPKPIIGAFDVASGIIKNRAKAWSFEEEDKNKTHNIDADKSTKSVQNDTTQAYNGFLINQQNLVE